MGGFTFNSLVNRRNQVRLAFASTDVQIKKRHDLIPNLVETVKGFAAHEREALESVTLARSKAAAPGSGWQAQETLHHEVARLIARAEAYPELKSDRQFLMLQRQLAECEAQIAAARRTYILPRVMICEMAKPQRQGPISERSGAWRENEKANVWRAGSIHSRIIRIPRAGRPGGASLPSSQGDECTIFPGCHGPRGVIQAVRSIQLADRPLSG